MEPGASELYSEAGRDEVIKKIQEWDAALWFNNSAEAAAALERGDIAISVEGIETAAPLVQSDPDNYGIVLPEDVAGFIDYYVVVRGTKKRDMAEAFLNYLIDPDLQSKWAEEVPYWMSNTKVEYGPKALSFLPNTQEERAAMAYMVDWGIIMEHHDAMDERLRKEVYTR